MRCLKQAPNLFWAHVILGWAYQQKSMHREAVAELQQAVQLTGGKMSFTLAADGQELAAAGDRVGAQTILARLEERARTGYVSAYEVALIHAALHEPDVAFEWLDRARHDRSSFLSLVTWDRRADILRSDSRFAALLKNLGLPTH